MEWSVARSVPSYAGKREARSGPARGDYKKKGKDCAVLGIEIAILYKERVEACCAIIAHCAKAAQFSQDAGVQRDGEIRCAKVAHRQE